jgi:hypothetical protein
MIEPPSFRSGKPFCTVNNAPFTFFGDLRDGNEFTDAGVRENNINSPLYRADSLVETIKICQFGGVPLNACDVSADRHHSLVEFPLTAARDEHIYPFIDEELCCSESYAFRAAGDNSNFSI